VKQQAIGALALLNAAFAGPSASQPVPSLRHFYVYFDFGSSALTGPAEETVREFAGFVRAGGPGGLVVLTAHADTFGPSEANLRISQKRGEAVASRLVQLGVSRDSIVIEAMGERQPPVPTGDGVKEQLNRLVWMDVRPSGQPR
jgi:outer membrane protein OmpA-like peptidoglycan-associated protein